MAKDASIGVNLVGRDTSASSTLEKVGKAADKTTHKFVDFGKKAAKAMAVAAAAAGALAIKMGVDAVKAAAADQKSTAMLAQALRNSTNATKAQIDAVGEYVDKQQLRYGIDDDLIKGGLSRLVRSTHDVTKAQKLMNLAIDVSAGTGKSLDTVVAALARGYDGNLGALSRLGVGLDKSIIKSKDFHKAQAAMEKAFGGSGAKAADTFAGRMASAREAIKQAQEKLGYMLLPIVEKFAKFLVRFAPTLQEWVDTLGKKFRDASAAAAPVLERLSDWFNNTALPAFRKVSDWFNNVGLPAMQRLWGWIQDKFIPGMQSYLTPIIEGLGKAWDTISQKIEDNRDKLQPLFDLFKTVADFIVTKYAPVMGKVLGKAFEVIGIAIGELIDLFATLVDWLDKAWGKIKPILDAIANSPLGKVISGVLGDVFGGARAGGGPVSAGKAYLVGERGPEMFVPSGSGSVVPNGRIGGGGVHLHFHGPVHDKESFFRAVAEANALTARRRGGAHA